MSMGASWTGSDSERFSNRVGKASAHVAYLTTDFTLPSLIPPLTQGSKSGSMGSRGSCSSPLASSLMPLPSQTSRSQSHQLGPLRRTVVRPGGWAELPWRNPSFLPICRLTVTHPSPTETPAVKEDQAKPGAPQVSGEKITPGVHRLSTEGQPQKQLPTRDPSGKEEELVLGLGHLNNSYNFSVSTCPAQVPPKPCHSWGTLLRPPSSPWPVSRGDRLQG